MDAEVWRNEKVSILLYGVRVRGMCFTKSLYCVTVNSKERLLMSLQRKLIVVE